MLIVLLLCSRACLGDTLTVGQITCTANYTSGTYIGDCSTVEIDNYTDVRWDNIDQGGGVFITATGAFIDLPGSTSYDLYYNFAIIQEANTIYAPIGAPNDNFAPYLPTVDFHLDGNLYAYPSIVIELTCDNGNPIVAGDSAPIIATAQPIPEPMTLLLIGTGVLGISFQRKRIF